MCRRILWLLLCSCSMAGHMHMVYAQNKAGAGMHPAILLFIQGITEDDIDGTGLGEGYMEELLPYLESLSIKGEVLSKEGIKRLAQNGLLDPFEEASLYSYIGKYGNPMSLAEFLLVPGIERKKLFLLSPFIRFETGSEIVPRRVHTDLLLRSTVDIGKPFLFYSKALAQIPGKASFIAVAEKDPGEHGLDYFSAGASYCGEGFIRNLVVGSYTAREGQGLVLWNGFSLNSLTDPSAVVKREYDPTVYGSADENRSFKGLATTFGKGKWVFDLMFSSRGLDARITPDGYTSLLVTGIHDSPVTIERKKSLDRNMVAATSNYEAGSLKLGLVFVGVSQSLPYAGKDTFELETNKIAGNKRGNLSLHWKKVYGKLLWYGEGALDICKRGALVTGISARSKQGSLVSLVVDYKQKGFSNPLTTHKQQSREGLPALNVSATTKLSKHMDISIWTLLALDYHKIACKLQLNDCLPGDVSWFTSVTKERLVSRMDYKMNPSQNLLLQTRGQVSAAGPFGNHSYGYNLQQDVVFKIKRLAMDVSARFGWFSADEWQNRLYSYERDILYQFRSALYYGRGFRWYLNLKANISRNLDFWFKYGSFYYTMDKKNGSDQSQDPFVSELKFQMRIRF